jgi:beta-lactamase superfamily II metal-dependent hydrolase
MVDVGDAWDFRPSEHIKTVMARSVVDYLFITNADQDHISDLDGLIQAGISIGVFTRNGSITPQQLQTMKQQSGSLTLGMRQYLALHEGYNDPVPRPFDSAMGGIRVRTYCNNYPQFTDTNNLSLVVVFEYNGFRIMFPGDLEEAGWLVSRVAEFSPPAVSQISPPGWEPSSSCDRTKPAFSFSFSR